MYDGGASCESPERHSDKWREAETAQETSTTTALSDSTSKSQMIWLPIAPPAAKWTNPCDASSESGSRKGAASTLYGARVHRQRHTSRATLPQRQCLGDLGQFRCSFFLFGRDDSTMVVTDEKDVEPAENGRARHSPHCDGDWERHEPRHAVREHECQHGDECPDGAFGMGSSR
jgi:hypothetical protein